MTALPRVSFLPDSTTFRQLWNALGSKLIEAVQESLPSKQVVVGSSPISRSTKLGDYLPR